MKIELPILTINKGKTSNTHSNTISVLQRNEGIKHANGLQFQPKKNLQSKQPKIHESKTRKREIQQEQSNHHSDQSKKTEKPTNY